MDPIQKSKDDWKKELDAETYHITREAGTEAPFTGKYHATHDKGMYKCSNCGLELFSSDAKFDSGTGWPSFTDPTNKERVELKEDMNHGMSRVEVLCKRCGAHLGHVFDDGPGPSCKRFCINSASLKLEKENAKK
ncbi:MAG: peptide-methionine (R)-S-oxide reductase [Parcubacteria group bacterium Gr01-1014_20]|nr:MAG: peptide-methionine (R)-S-oxide reductase [Parcubacteria group bacterium Gr01-1014_20]